MPEDASILHFVATATNPELEAQILARPDDTSAYLVYGDWLSERGDPRGELVALQVRLSAKEDAGQRARERELLGEHGGQWLGALAELGGDDAEVVWRNGFVHRVRLGPDLDEHATSEQDFPELIRALCTLPAARLLDELIIGSIDYDDYPTSWEPCVDALAESDVPARLRRLEFNRGGYWDISSTELGNLEPAYPKLRNLEALRIELGAMELGTVDLPRLRSLETVTGGMTVDNLESIGAAQWPHLETMSLYLGEEGGDYGGDVSADNVMDFLARVSAPKLRHLGLCNSNHADELAQRLAGSGILPQLQTLDFTDGTLGDEGARALIEHARHFRHLSQIRARHHYVSDRVLNELTAAFEGEATQIQLTAPEADDDGYRYVCVSE